MSSSMAHVMTLEEVREIDKKVAVELGATVERCEAKYGAPAGYRLSHTVSVMMEVRPTPIRRKEPISCDEEQAWRRVARYTTDPQAADLVRLEIERRGWVWSIGPWEDGMYACTVSGGSYRCSKPPYGIAQGDSPWVALCLAFLAACEQGKDDTTAPQGAGGQKR